MGLRCGAGSPNSSGAYLQGTRRGTNSDSWSEGTVHLNPPRKILPATVITGASSGIGRSIANIAAREKGAIVLVGRSLEGLQETAASVEKAGGRPYILDLDLTTEDALAELDQLLERNALFCEVLVNSAGHGIRGAAIALPLRPQLSIVDLNISALARLTLHYLPGMVERKKGGVINFSSVAGFTAGPYMSLYYASKSFVRSFSASLYQEVKKSGVTVTCVAPGPVRTGFFENASAEQAGLFNLLPRLEPDFVAERAWEGFKSRKRLVVPGISAKLSALAATVIPSPLMLPLIGRLQRSGNDPCPCGSGKKFKRCCGRKAGVKRLANFRPEA